MPGSSKKPSSYPSNTSRYKYHNLSPLFRCPNENWTFSKKYLTPIIGAKHWKSLKIWPSTQAQRRGLISRLSGIPINNWSQWDLHSTLLKKKKKKSLRGPLSNSSSSKATSLHTDSSYTRLCASATSLSHLIWLIILVLSPIRKVSKWKNNQKKLLETETKKKAAATECAAT